MRDAPGRVPLVPPVCAAFGEVSSETDAPRSLVSGGVCPGLSGEHGGKVCGGMQSRLREQSLRCRECLCQPNQGLIVRIAILFIFNYEVALYFKGQK